MTADLVAFLRARLDVEETVAREATAGPWFNTSTGSNFDKSTGPSEAVFTARPAEGTPCVARTSTAGDRQGMVNAEHIASWDPARVLAEVDAKRQLIVRGDTLFCACDTRGGPPMDPDTNWTVPIPHHYDCTAYRIAQVLALPYVNHPDYRPEWAPDGD